MAVKIKKSMDDSSSGTTSITTCQPEAEITLVKKESGKVVAETAQTAALKPVKNEGYGGLAEITVINKFTKNLGNFESLQVGVSLKMPVNPNRIDEEFDTVKTWVDNKLSSILEEVDNCG